MRRAAISPRCHLFQTQNGNKGKKWERNISFNEIAQHLPQQRWAFWTGRAALSLSLCSEHGDTCAALLCSAGWGGAQPTEFSCSRMTKASYAIKQKQPLISLLSVTVPKKLSAVDDIIWSCVFWHHNRCCYPYFLDIICLCNDNLENGEIVVELMLRRPHCAFYLHHREGNKTSIGPILLVRKFPPNKSKET